MLTIPFLMTITLLLVNPFAKETTVIAESKNPTSIKTEIETLSVTSEETAEPTFSTTATKEIIEAKELPAILKTAEIIESIDNQINPAQTNPEVVKEARDITTPKIALIKDDATEKINPRPQQGANIAIQNLKPDFEKSAILSDFKMKKIRKRLYKNLVEDGIIASKSIPVEMQLPGDKIYVNGKAIPSNLFSKYAGITSEVKTGPNRKIKISKRYVIIGDFNLDGFYGAGLGAFNNILLEKAIKNNSAELERKKLFDTEYKGLFDFAKDIRIPKVANPILFGVDLNAENCQLLHEQIYNQLKADQLINNDHEFVLIQYQKEKLILNGVTLSGTQKSNYSDIISSFKIKPGEYREILLSKHIICVGDKVADEFTGTIDSFF